MAILKTKASGGLNYSNPKNILKQSAIQSDVPSSTTQVRTNTNPISKLWYTLWTSIDNRVVKTTSGNPYIAYSQREKPTVATTNQPVISKTINNSLIYDTADPEDYLMKLQARSITGKIPTEQEYYQALQAQKALQTKQASTVNPLQVQIDEMMRRQQEEKVLEADRDTNELDVYRKQLDQQYWVQKDELIASWERQRSAAQNIYSFSWFWRSSVAANKMADIQEWIDWAIIALNNAKEIEIARKRAELEGADSETLSSLNNAIQQHKNKANIRQMESLQQTSEANQKSGASYIESLNNLMTTASKNGMDIWNPEDIQIYAQMARNPDGSINEEFVGALPEWMQAIIRTANIQQSKDAPRTENFGTTKSPRYMQRDGIKRVPVAWASQRSVWGNGWVSGGRQIGSWTWWTAQQQEVVWFDPNLASVYRTVNNWRSLDIQRFTKLYWKSAKELQAEATAWKISQLWQDVWVALDTVDNLTSKYPWRASAIASEFRVSTTLNPALADFKAQYDYIKSNLTMDKLISLKDSWATFGALSDSERVSIWNAANAIRLDMSEQEFKKQLAIISNALKKSIWGKDPRQASKTQTNNEQPTVQPSQQKQAQRTVIKWFIWKVR